MALIAAAGPLSNFLVAAIAGLPLQAGWVPWLPPFNVGVINSLIRGGWGADEYLGLYLSAIVLISIILGVFNLLPIFPLDGHRLIPPFLTDEAARSYMHFQARYGFIILIVLIALPFLTGGQFGILFEVMGPVINLFARLFTGADQDVFG
jgi:Zn-dependent protease